MRRSTRPLAGSALLATLALSPAIRSAPGQGEPAPPADPLAGILAPRAKVAKLAGGLRFTEGPVWIRDGGYLVFSDVAGDEMKKWDGKELTSFRRPSHRANGNRLDAEGRLVTCEHETRRLTRTDREGKVEVLVEGWEGHRFHSPNDLVIGKDGTIWFTDPPYGLGERERELEGNFVFRFRPATGELAVVVRDFDRPNGVELSPDEKRLYVADSGAPRCIRAFDIAKDGTLSGGDVFARIDAGVPDGIRCDEAGRLYSSAGDGVHVFDAAGKLLGRIPVPEQPSNLCFGGPAGKTLYITARMSLYSIELAVAGREFAAATRQGE
ncbi:MAG: SMP-30/gluconolactonase/LRE family protein [Planctomycetota bacterium]